MEFDWKKVKVFQVVKRNCVSGITSGWRAKAVRHLNVEPRLYGFLIQCIKNDLLSIPWQAGQQ